MTRVCKSSGTGKKVLCLTAKLSLFIVVLAAVLGMVFHKEILRLYHVITLFDADKIAHNFRNMDTLFDVRSIKKANSPSVFQRELAMLPPSFTYKGRAIDTEQFLKDTWTTGLLVVKDNKILEKDRYGVRCLWIIDSQGMEAAFGGLNVVLRDYARFGLLYLNNGQYNGEQIVPAQWVKDSITPDAPHLQPGKCQNSSWILGYGYQWWIPEKPESDFMAIGIYNQYIYLYKASGTVVVKLSAYPNYNEDGEQKTLQSIQLFKKIARTM
jgi:CubicO group peptidase (beta-lactamase class C family)